MDTKFNKTQDTVLNGIVRHILTAADGALVTKGYFADTELELTEVDLVTAIFRKQANKAGFNTIYRERAVSGKLR
jgi:sulfur carrier protein ThiS